MKKIFYLVFFISLCFLVNVNLVSAAGGYCEYSLSEFSDGYIYEDMGDASIKFKIDTNNKNHVDIEWNINYENEIDNDYKAYYVNLGYKNMKYVIGFNENELYDKMIKGNEFSCPNLYALHLTMNEATTITIYPNSFEGDGQTIQLNLIDQKKPETTDTEKLINKCGVAIKDSRYTLPDNMTIEFKKYTTRNEVCVNYFQGGSYCKDYIPNNYFSLSTESQSIPRTFNFKNEDLDKIFSNITSTSNSCPDLWIDYTDSFNGQFHVSLDKPDNEMSTETTGSEYEEVLKKYELYNGERFKQAKCQLNYYLSANSIFNQNKNAITNNGSYISFDDCTNGTYNDDMDLLNHHTTNSLKDVRNVCNEVYAAYGLNHNNSQLKSRKTECENFNDFYQKLIEYGIVNDLSEGCDILSDDLKDKLVWVLDIIKIAGPILALGLGTLDFIKVLANGDADKEMKTAFKRFMTRLGAAALLFIIPLILAFLLDMFLGNQDGYDSNNPFCIKIDWDE